jgi:phosphoribosylpyrophosphate synthetase
MNKENDRRHDKYRFANGSSPDITPEGRMVVAHAVEVPYAKAALLWDERNEKIKEIRSDYQVAVLHHGSDVESQILNSNNPIFSRKHPVNSFDRKVFPGGEDLLFARNESPLAKHIYLIADPLDKGDIMDIQRVAWYYRNILQAQHVTAVLSFISGRQDKNVNSEGNYVPSMINITADIEAMGSVDSFMGSENHSFATQTAAYIIGKPFFPFTPWKYSVEQVLNKNIEIDNENVMLTPQNTVLVRPDKGRNIAATRTANYYGFESISFNKKRISAKKVLLYLDSPEEIEKIKGKICICYDDELSTNHTVNEVAKKLEEYGARGLVVIGIHGKFTADWKENIGNPFIKKVFTTDSRPPIGDIRPYIDSGKIEIIPSEDLIAEIIEADIKGINFWNDPNYCHMVLQTNGESERC